MFDKEINAYFNWGLQHIFLYIPQNGSYESHLGAPANVKDGREKKVRVLASRAASVREREKRA